MVLWEEKYGVVCATFFCVLGDFKISILIFLNRLEIDGQFVHQLILDSIKIIKLIYY